MNLGLGSMPAKAILFVLVVLTAGCSGGTVVDGGNPPPLATISAQPVAATVYETQTASFFVTASSSVTLSYQWYKNGTVISGTNYTTGGPGLAIPGYSFAGMYLKFNSAYTPSAPVTAAFAYYWRVRFESDRQEFEKFMHMLWTAGDRGGAAIKFRSARAYAAGA